MPEFTHITEKLKTVNRRQKAKLLVVDDEPDNLDLLYRTFRRDFQVLKANNGIEALEVLEAEGEVAVIISDQRMPEMKGTEFLSRTVPQFPNTIRIILTGFTDVEDLVEAINAGQVYRYITKPWDPAELKEVVQIATETYDLVNDRLEALEQGRIQTQLLAKILESFIEERPIESILDDLTAAIATALNAEGCLIQIQKEGMCQNSIGKSSTLPTEITLPDGDPLIAQVRETKELQIWLESRTTPAPEGIDYYQQSQIKQHVLVPLIYRQDILAFLSLQWLDSFPLRESELNLLHLASQQIAFALISQKSC